MKTLTVKTTADVVAAVPILLGFQPENSIVLMCTQAAGHAFHARVDAPRNEDDLNEILNNLAPVCDREGVTEAVLGIYTNNPQMAWIADGIVAGLHRINFRDVLHVTDTHLRSMRNDGAPQPYDLSTHPVIAEAVAEGRVVLRQRDDLGASLRGGHVTNAVREAFEEHRLDDAEPAELREHALWTAEQLRTCLDTGTMPTDAAVGRLAAVLTNLQVRDIAWSLITRDNAAGYVHLFSDLTRRVPETASAATAALCGFAAWLHGDGALAWVAVDRAREVVADYGMASLLSQALTLAIPPHTWQPLDQDELMKQFAA